MIRYVNFWRQLQIFNILEEATDKKLKFSNMRSDKKKVFWTVTVASFRLNFCLELSLMQLSGLCNFFNIKQRNLFARWFQRHGAGFLDPCKIVSMGREGCQKFRGVIYGRPLSINCFLSQFQILFCRPRQSGQGSAGVQMIDYVLTWFFSSNFHILYRVFRWTVLVDTTVWSLWDTILRYL
jgi:hypothetical protein